MIEPKPASDHAEAAESWRGHARAVAARLSSAPPRLGAVRLVGIDGPSGSGKSSFADALVVSLRDRGECVGLVRTDDFATWEEPFDWWPRLESGVLTPLSGGRPGRYRRTEWTAEGHPFEGSWVDVPSPGVLVLEGVSATRRAVVPRLSLSVWVELADSSVRLVRSVARDGELCRSALVRWQTDEARWFARDGARRRAEVLLSQPRSGGEVVARGLSGLGFP